MTKLNKLINEKFWKQIQENFKEEVNARLVGKEDLNNSKYHLLLYYFSS